MLCKAWNLFKNFRWSRCNDVVSIFFYLHWSPVVFGWWCWFLLFKPLKSLVADSAWVWGTDSSHTKVLGTFIFWDIAQCSVTVVRPPGGDVGQGPYYTLTNKFCYTRWRIFGQAGIDYPSTKLIFSFVPCLSLVIFYNFTLCATFDMLLCFLCCELLWGALFAAKRWESDPYNPYNYFSRDQTAAWGVEGHRIELSATTKSELCFSWK